MLVGDALELLDNLESKNRMISHEVLKKIQQRSKDLAIVMSIPGFGLYQHLSSCKRSEITAIFSGLSSSSHGVDSILEAANVQAKRENVESQSQVLSTSELYLY